MKLLAIPSSLQGWGLTVESAKQVIRGAEAIGHETELINLNEAVIKKCKVCDGGWGQCLREGTCILR